MSKQLTVVTNNPVPAPKPKGGIIGTTIKELDTVQNTRELVQRLIRDMEKINYGHAVAETKEAVEVAQAYMADGGYAEAQTELDVAVDFADDALISEQIKLLMGSWPNVAKADLAAFGAVLVAEIKSMAVSRYAIAQGCRKLRRTMKFIPSIAETLEAIEAANESILELSQQHSTLPKSVENAIERIAVRAELEAETQWKETVKAKAGFRCQQCGDDQSARWVKVVWEAADKSDARCVCPYCANHPKPWL